MLIVSLPVRAKSITKQLQEKHRWELHKKRKSMVFPYSLWLDQSELVLKSLYDHGITSVHSLVKAPIPLKEAMERGGFLEFSAK